MNFSYGVGFTWSASSTSTSTTLPTGEITIDSGTAPHIVGSQSDPADFYGIVLVVLAIVIALVATRWLFGRSGPRGR